MAERQVSVVKAFASYAGDGSGEQRYFTAGNAHEVEVFVSEEEFEYRKRNGYVEVAEAFEEPERTFVAPEEDPTPVDHSQELVEEQPARATTRGTARKGRRAATTEE